MFGTLNPVSLDEYFSIYKMTGMDIDGRRELIKELSHVYQEEFVAFSKFILCLPGFQLLHKDDQLKLMKSKLLETIRYIT